MIAKMNLKSIGLVALFLPSVTFGAVLGGYGDDSPAPRPPSNTQQNTSTQNMPKLTPQQQQALQQLQAQSVQQSSPSGQQAGSANSPAPRPTPQNELDKMRQELEDARTLVDSPGEAMRDEAFSKLLEQALPLSPDQIKTLRRLYDISQRATAETPNAPPKPTSSSTRVQLDPGHIPPIIRLSQGFVSSLVFIDSTGSAWPITSYSIGDPEAFNIQWDQKSNALFVQSLKLYSHGNLAVRLHGLSTPIMLSLVSGQKDVDFRVDLQVAGRGPEATAPIMPESFTDAKVNQKLINVLDGIPPQGSVKLTVSGNHGDAWLHDDKLYFRTKLTLLSPAWMGTVSSPDGTHVYELMYSPMLLASKDGQTINLQLTGL